MTNVSTGSPDWLPSAGGGISMPLGEDDLSVIQTELVDLRALIHKGVFLSRQTYVLIEIKKA